MSEIVKICKKHGNLDLTMVYGSKAKSKKGTPTYTYKCKECVYENQRNRPCRIHGEISLYERVPSGGCRYCCTERLRNVSTKRNNNRADFNEKERLKREANPEKAAEQYKARYQRDVELHGKDKLNERQKERRLGLIPGDLKRMTEEQDNKCAICRQPETRIFRQRTEKGEMTIAKLCIDHNHFTNKVRGLLCRSCNTAIGLFKEDISLIQNAIEYLIKHNERG